MRDDHSISLSAALGAGADCLIFRGNQLLVDEAGAPPSAWRDYLTAVAPLRLIPTGGGQGGTCFVAEVAREAEAPRGHEFRHLKGLLDALPRALRERAMRSLELLEFDRAHQYCGACGALTILKPDRIARLCSNDACAREHFPRVSPVVIMAVERGPEILLGRSPHFAPGLYSTLAGFVDAGESAEDAVQREVFEETGLHVRNLCYVASQPWPFPHALMLGYRAEYAGGEIVCAVDEIEDARFFHVDHLPPVFPMKYAMASVLLDDFCKRHGRPGFL